jgi:hypothetical protein
VQSCHSHCNSLCLSLSLSLSLSLYVCRHRKVYRGELCYDVASVRGDRIFDEKLLQVFYCVSESPRTRAQRQQ